MTMLIDEREIPRRVEAEGPQAIQDYLDGKYQVPKAVKVLGKETVAAYLAGTFELPTEEPAAPVAEDTTTTQKS
jgi:hypothetical protein